MSDIGPQWDGDWADRVHDDDGRQVWLDLDLVVAVFYSSLFRTFLSRSLARSRWRAASDDALGPPDYSRIVGTFTSVSFSCSVK